VRALAYAWEEARQSLNRGRWALLLAVATIAVALTMLGAFRVVSENVARVAEGWRTAAEMTVYLDDVVTEAERTATRQLIERDPAVDSVVFVTKEEALARFGADFPELGDITGSLENNPFPASFDVRLRTDGSPDGAQALAAALAKQAGVVDVRYDQRWIGRLLAVLAALRTAGWAAALALVLGAATTVVAVVRLSFEARREEIAIMGLVGAPVSYIRGPFVMEGAIQGALGAVAALGALASLGRVVGRALGPAVTALGPDALRPLSGWDAVGLVVLGAGVGALAGLLATWRWDPDPAAAGR
jgi:cell division transport system permease protein